MKLYPFPAVYLYKKICYTWLFIYVRLTQGNESLLEWELHVEILAVISIVENVVPKLNRDGKSEESNRDQLKEEIRCPIKMKD